MISIFRNCIIFFCFIIDICKTIRVKDSSEFLNAINKNEKVIQLSNSIILNESVTISNKEITIEGVQNKKIIIEFNNISNKFTFKNEYGVLNIKNININGNIVIYNIKNVYFDNVVMFGTIDANSEISHNNLISINKLKINCLESNNISYDSCFNIINYDMSILN